MAKLLFHVWRRKGDWAPGCQLTVASVGRAGGGSGAVL